MDYWADRNELHRNPADGTGTPDSPGTLLPGSPDFAAKVLASSLNGIYIYDINRGQNIFVNSRYTDLTGYTSEDIRSMNPAQFLSLFHPEDRKKITAHLQKVVRSDSHTHEIEYRFKTKDGRWIWCLSRDSVFARAKDGSALQYIGTFLDITDTKNLEQALHKKERRYRELVENANSAILQWKPDGTITFFNNYARTFFGYSTEEILGKHVNILVPEEESTGSDLSGLAEDIVAHPEKYIHNINENIRRDGRRVWMAWANKPVFDDQGRLVGILAVGNDITMLKQTEKTLKESEERFAAVLKNSIDAIYRRNLKTDQYDYISPAIFSILGFSPDEMKSMPKEVIFQRLHPEDRKAVENEIEKVKTGGSTLLEYRFKTKSGQYTWVADTIHVLTDPDGVPHYRDGIIRDISEQKRSEFKLKQMNLSLEGLVAERTRELEKRTGQLLWLTLELSQAEEKEQQRIAQILHDDLQQVLVSAKLQLEIVENEKDPFLIQKGIRKSLEMLVESLNKTRDLSHDLSPPALTRSGLTDALRWLSGRMRKDYGLEICLDLKTEIRPQSATIERLLYRTARELLFNVVKHAREKKAWLELRYENNGFFIIVADKGSGFDTRVNDADTMGFGLMSIKERAYSLGGSFQIRSEPEKGTLATIFIPDKNPDDTDSAPTPEHSEHPTTL